MKTFKGFLLLSVPSATEILQKEAQAREEAVKTSSHSREIFIINKIVFHQGLKENTALIFLCYIGRDDI